MDWRVPSVKTKVASSNFPGGKTWSKLAIDSITMTLSLALTWGFNFLKNSINKGTWRAITSLQESDMSLKDTAAAGHKSGWSKPDITKWSTLSKCWGWFFNQSE